MSTLVSLNGVIVEPEAATISVFDRGFLYGDSVYEVIRTYRGVPFELEAHLDRLEGSADRIGMALPVPQTQIAEEVAATHQATGNGDSYLRIVVTRGGGDIGLDPALARNPQRIIIAQSLKPPGPEVYRDGASIALVSVRKNLRRAIDPQAKTGNYLNSVMALAEARQRGAFEAVMLDHHDFVTEGASSNIFTVKNGVVHTPPLEAGILMGVTRAVLFKVAAEAGVEIREEHFREDSLKEADEVLITSSIREVVPIVRVDETMIADGRPGPIYTKLRRAFDAYVDRYVSARSS